MSTPSAETIRSPFENVINFIGGLPHGHEKALKHAFYNALALFLLVVCSAAGWASFIILEPFIKPLIWALLCGSALHPFKRSLAGTLQTWIHNLEISRSPLLVGVIMTPITIIDDISERIGSQISRHMKPIIITILSILTIVLMYNYTPHICVCLAWRVGSYGNAICGFIIGHTNTLVVVTLLIGYILTLAMMWRPQVYHLYTVSSCVMWVLVSCYLANFTGSFKMLTFFIIQLFFLVGFMYEVWYIQQENVDEGNDISITDAMKLSLTTEDELPMPTKSEQPPEAGEESEPGEGRSGSPVPGENNPGKQKPTGLFLTTVATTERRPSKESLASSMSMLFPHSLESDKYLYGVTWGCVLMLLWKYLWVLHLIPIPVSIYIFKHVGASLGLWGQISKYARYIYDLIYVWCMQRKHALFPPSVRGLVKLQKELNKTVVQSLKDSIDSAASIVVIFGLIMFTICASIFIAVQLYAECIHIVQVCASAINSTVVHNEELMKLLPEGWQDKINSVLDDAYVYGREGISNLVRRWLKDVDQSKAVELEQQLLELWDHVYQAWMMSAVETSPVGPSVSSSAVFASWDNVLNYFHKTPELFNVTAIVAFARENLETLMSLVDSLWTLFKGNISLALYSFTAFFSVVFGGGFAVLNFIVNLVVFLTALFYLLSSSGNLYKPFDLITNFSPQSGGRFARALEEAVNGVFKASFKMAVFFGLWTWLVHNFFQVQVVYLPSVLAAIFGAVPFLGTYWAGVPAVLDLWLQDKSIQAALLFLCHFLPCSLVNTAFYKEIKGGGHPYLTGLAIAGGIFCLGVEGAIVGPLVLCGLYVAVNMSSSFMKDSPSEVALAGRFGHLGNLRGTARKPLNS